MPLNNRKFYQAAAVDASSQKCNVAANKQAEETSIDKSIHEPGPQRGPEKTLAAAIAAEIRNKSLAIEQRAARTIKPACL